MAKRRPCAVCLRKVIPAHSIRLYCPTCSRVVRIIRKQVNAAMLAYRPALAVLRKGPCVDCGKPATCLDHRHYSQPFEVARVCDACNIRRGPALDLLGALRPL